VLEIECERAVVVVGSQLRDVTTERISSLEWRVPKLEKTIAAYREGIKDLT
jgi:hypothetical protein